MFSLSLNSFLPHSQHDLPVHNTFHQTKKKICPHGKLDNHRKLFFLAVFLDRTCKSIGVQVGNGDDEMPFCKNKSSECVLTLVEQTSQSTESKEVVIDEGQKTVPEYMCACCCGCLLCERGYPWYSLEGKGEQLSSLRLSITYQN